MAIAERSMAAQFNTDEHQIVDHYTYAFMGDGCMMEGISHEACSLAGTLGLGKLVAFWDDNGISIDGEVEAWFTDNTPARFEAYGWQVIAGVDGHDADQIHAAIKQAQADLNKPTLVCCKTVIGKGAPNKQGTENCHGAPLGVEEILLVRDQLGWTAEPFTVPEILLQSGMPPSVELKLNNNGSLASMHIRRKILIRHLSIYVGCVATCPLFGKQAHSY